MIVHVTPETMRRQGLDRERRHRAEGMTRWVRRSRLLEPADRSNVIDLDAHRRRRGDDPEPPDGGTPGAAQVHDLPRSDYGGAFNARAAA